MRLSVFTSLIAQSMQSIEPHKFKVNLARIMAEFGYFGTFTLVFAWQSWLSPHPQLSAGWMTFLWCLPLLFPLKGMIQRKPYTHAWSCFIACLYLCHGLVQLYVTPTEWWLAWAEVLLVGLWLIGAILFARWQGQVLGLGLKKKK